MRQISTLLFVRFVSGSVPLYPPLTSPHCSCCVSRVLLNKADTIDTQQLMRVYGALMWSLGKVMQTPEVCRVYIGSFWEAPLSNPENRLLLEVRALQLPGVHHYPDCLV